MKAGRKGFCFSVCIFAHPLICLISSYRLKGRMNARKMIFTGVKWFTALIKIVYTWQQMFMCKKTGQRLALLNPYKITFGSCWVWFMLWSSYSCQYHSLLPLWSVYLPLNPYYLTACGCRGFALQQSTTCFLCAGGAEVLVRERTETAMPKLTDSKDSCWQDLKDTHTHVQRYWQSVTH